MIEWPQVTGKAYDPAEEITITLTRKQWYTVLHSLQHIVDKLRATVLWWKEFCSDKRYGAETAAGYEQDLAKVEEIMAAIEKATEQE